jgi:hypothetical protein
MLTHRLRRRGPLQPAARAAGGVDPQRREWPLFGFVLAPNGIGTRMITRFVTHWVFDGTRWRLIDGWKGNPWVVYHLLGFPKGSNSRRATWPLPRRDVGGASSKCSAAWRREFDAPNARIFRRST